MLVLDLFCGAGGAAAGYVQAGHQVIGVDISAQRSFPYPFWQTDAITFLESLIAGKRFRNRATSDRVYSLDDFEFIHASPPCQLYSAGNRAHTANPHPDLVDITRELLIRTGKPYVIENVPGAPLDNPVELCGRMFNLGAHDTDGQWLQLDRHRLFEASFALTPPPTCRPHNRTVQVGGVYRGARRDKFEARYIRGGGYVPANLGVLQALLGIDWMSETELYLAIPPRYTYYIIREYMRTHDSLPH